MLKQNIINLKNLKRERKKKETSKKEMLIKKRCSLYGRY
jgi:hypothetical protein